MALFVGLGCAAPAPEPAAGVADLILVGGPVLTMNREQPEAEGVAVADGEIVAVGSRQEVLRWRGETTEVVELGGRALLPGFVDAHGHLSLQATQLGGCNVASPPVGRVTDITTLQEELRACAAELGEEDWIVGFGYDDSLLAEQRHPNRFDLGAVSAQRPVFLLHVSGHLAALNGRALALAGIAATTGEAAPPPSVETAMLVHDPRPGPVASRRASISRSCSSPVGSRVSRPKTTSKLPRLIALLSA